MKLKLIQKPRLRHVEHFQFAERVLQLCKEANVEKLTAVLKPLSDAIAAEDEALNQSKVMFGTEDLVKLDDARDKAYYALKMLVGMHLNSDDEETVKAAKRLREVMSRYPNTAKVDYDTETGMIKNLIADTKEDDMPAMLARLNAVPAVTRLDNANKAFDAVFHNRVQVSEASGKFDVRALRYTVDKALDAVLTRITALIDLDPTPPIEKLVKQYNFLVEYRQNVLADRKSSNKSAHERTMDKYAALIEPLFAELERERGLSSGALSFAREFRGTGKKRAYLLNVAGKSPIWVVISKGKLVVVPEPSGKSTGSGSKPSGGNGSGSGGNGSGGNGGNKPGGGTGGGTPKPGREEDPGEDKV